jgi:hypothetical protein
MRLICVLTHFQRFISRDYALLSAGRYLELGVCEWTTRLDSVSRQRPIATDKKCVPLKGV